MNRSSWFVLVKVPRFRLILYLWWIWLHQLWFNRVSHSKFTWLIRVTWTQWLWFSSWVHRRLFYVFVLHVHQVFHGGGVLIVPTVSFQEWRRLRCIMSFHYIWHVKSLINIIKEMTYRWWLHLLVLLSKCKLLSASRMTQLSFKGVLSWRYTRILKPAHIFLIRRHYFAVGMLLKWVIECTILISYLQSMWHFVSLCTLYLWQL